MAIFYKGVLISDLKSSYIPGTVTTSFNEALMWSERISSNKNKGAARNVKHGSSTIIKIEYDESLLRSHEQFQVSGVMEHDRQNCWTSQHKTKAQINTPVSYRVLSEYEINKLFKL